MTRKELVVQMLIEHGTEKSLALSAVPASLESVLSQAATPEYELHLKEEFDKEGENALLWVMGGMKGPADR